MTFRNRRKRVTRRGYLFRMFGSGNRRVVKRASAKAADLASEAVSSSGLRAGLRRFGTQALLTAKVTLLVAATVGVGFGGYQLYRRARASTYFNVEVLRIEGARRASRAELRRLLGEVKGRNIFSADLDRLARALEAHPWVERAEVRRELPRTLAVQIKERRARALLVLGSLYLVDVNGVVFKRTRLDEAEGLPTITGISRREFGRAPVLARARLKRALAAIDRYYQEVRPPISELHLGPQDELTFFLRKGGVALRFGHRFGDERLRKLDVIWASLGRKRRRVRAVYLDNEVRPERVVVRLGASVTN